MTSSCQDTDHAELLTEEALLELERLLPREREERAAQRRIVEREFFGSPDRTNFSIFDMSRPGPVKPWAGFFCKSSKPYGLL